MALRSGSFLWFGLATTLSLSACLSRTDWGGPEHPPTTRSQLEQLRGAALEGGDVNALTAYMAYLWEFDYEHRMWLDLVEVGKSPKQPESLSGFDRPTYTSEVVSAWTAARPAEVPRSAERIALLQADFYATALSGGCRDTQRAMGPLLVLLAEEGEGAVDLSHPVAVAQSECGPQEDVMAGACRAGAELIADLPEPTYDAYAAG